MFNADTGAQRVRWLDVTPHNSNNLPAGCRGIYVGGTGNLALVGEDNVAVTFTAVPQGTFLNVGPKRVNATGTSATAIVAMY